MTSRFSALQTLLPLLFSIILTGSFLPSPAKAAEPPTLHIVTDSFAPLQYLENGEPAGYVIEYINATITKIRSRHPLQVEPVEFLPWKRALLVAKETPNTLFFSVLRTQEREDSYQWIETVSPYQRFFFSLRGKTVTHPKDLSELRDSSLVVGVQRGSADEALLEQHGFKLDYDYTTFTHFDQGIKMLYHDRIDIIPLTSFLARTTVCKAGFDGDQLETLFAIENFTDVLWATMSHNSDPSLIADLQQAMAELKEEGYYNKVLEQHLGAWENRPCVAE
ncbi:ABC transporter substrate-binding protein [Kiloniella laminariae]|uniref:ABC transporter substrate-binding protein n=1 Tax=Kiloniella laminariae TaxID=454162 RepID=A0ABT4LEV1_9PROT|nr:ABC transporter substrate-binding protein [Kiloniella laminariae]MCZ4279620.1 ABC transporter substrate-binding protein [Kiloniella laminariae]